MPRDDLQNYMRRSPLSYVGNVKMLTMLVTGKVDYRTPSSDAEQFYTELQLRKCVSDGARAGREPRYFGEA